MTKKGYYEYDPEVYPRRLYIMIGATEEDVRKCFDDVGEPDSDGKDDIAATTIPEVISKANGKYGNLIVFRSKRDMDIGKVSHEAFHVLGSIMDVMPLKREPYGTNEHLSYLLQWIVRCIDNARQGIGNFTEIRDIKEE